MPCITLVNKDSKGKLRIVIASYQWNDEKHGYVISRSTGTFKGKLIEQPEILIERGKATRTVSQQAELEFNSIIKKYKDKGYKELTKPVEEYTEKELLDLVGSVTTSQDGVPKPMLAKQEDKVTNRKIFDKEWYASRKIDGLRVLLYLGKDNKIHAQSRGASNYDAAMCEILSHPTLVELFNKYPNLIMDGEAYKHGMSLQQLNSIARTQVTANDYSILQFYWYDIVDPGMSFKDRLKFMGSIKKELSLEFNPERTFSENELRIQFVPQVPIKGWDNIIKLHDEFVSEGWEGLVIRDPSKPYKPNGRTNDMIKVKKYQDDCFKIVGKEAGLRGAEDMVFIMEMPDGRTFKAKPFGDRLQKEDYWNNFEELYKGKIGECKFFYYSDDGCPLQPSFKAVREDISDE